MRANTLKTGLFVSLFLLVTTLFAQGSRCADIRPFCAGNEELVFENSNRLNSEVVAGESGPDYGCVEFPRYPSWFYLQIEDSGYLEFLISQSENEDGSGEALDVDFVIWGPFNASEDYCNNELLSEKNHVDCSYSEDAVEVAAINNAKKGEVYVFLITNYSELPGFINLKQTNNGSNAGSTNCAILNGILGADKVVCGENETILNAEVQGAIGYQWFVFDENNDDFVQLEAENKAQLKVTVSGTYRVLIQNADGDNTIGDNVEVTFYDRPVIKEPVEAIFVCEQDSLIDLTIKQTELLSLNASPEFYKVEYFETEEGALNNNKIPDPENYSVSRETILARIVNLESGCISDIVAIHLDIRRLPETPLEENYRICVDAYGLFNDELVLGKDFGKSYEYSWYNGEELISSEYDLYLYEESANPNYTLVLTEKFTGCEVRFSTTVSYVSEPNSVKVDILKGDFENSWTVEINASRNIGHSSEFEYSLDNGAYTSDPVFRNIQRGVHELQIREAGGCGEVVVKEFTVVGYDFFFTPNGDGYNDRWSVTQDADYKVLKIRVFDRNGVFLKNIDPDGEGWDGLVNGKLLPEDDYWFNLEYVNFKTSSRHNFSAHFSLIK
ncbi:T9SS type B sorting domain-containing protein [Zunongwangia profunda]|jgi:gliding motility-associated-like protein|uniref:T9SS type B sorting domain-containing protein n=1 Tax=Zunongwangia profunda TaxID=398743 RepID=UPI001D196F34|nr:T9SS type B sorting domain-containing protein [Zunongwangia profunda]MCC4228300.1 T9SS type B sorting domain-containing protein [Zunongwangia profunda]